MTSVQYLTSYVSSSEVKRGLIPVFYTNLGVCLELIGACGDE